MTPLHQALTRVDPVLTKRGYDSTGDLHHVAVYKEDVTFTFLWDHKANAFIVVEARSGEAPREIGTVEFHERDVKALSHKLLRWMR